MSYRNWTAWQRSVDLSVSVFLALRRLSGPETFAFCDQSRRAALSVPNNDAEAFGRFSFRDQRQFVIRARGSLFELETLIEIGRRLEILDKETVRALFGETTDVARLLHGLIRFMSRQEREQAASRPTQERIIARKPSSDKPGDDREGPGPKV